jgi:signal transduction histidine kinase
VEDDGQGFSIPERATMHGHFGLQGMRERAASLGGELTLRSNAGVGTLVELIVPITIEEVSQR